MSNNLKWLWPVPAVTNISQYYINTETYSHKGIDITNGDSTYGKNVVASRDGTVEVILSGCNNRDAKTTRESCSSSKGCLCYNIDTIDGVSYCHWGMGNSIFIRHDEVDDEGNAYSVYSQYCHLKSFNVIVGDTVKMGQVIGKVGSTGESETAHLHFSLSNNIRPTYAGTRFNNNTDVIDYVYATTSTIDLYRNHTSTDAVLYKNDLEYTAGSGDVINGGAAPTRTGYRFLGWYTARTGGTKVTKYSDIPEGTTALYAQWVETVTVSFYDDLASNGGKLIETRTYEVGKKYSTVGFPSPGTRVGYTFDKWYTATGGYVETWSDVTKTRTALYAHWNANTYTVTLKNNDGTNISKNHNIQFGGKYGDALAALDDRCGYSFVEWNTKADGTGTVYNENSNAEAKNITLHAIWEVKKVEVNYKYGYEVNGEEKTGSGEVDYGDTYGDVVGTNVPDMDNMVHPDGSYDFVGWYHDKVEEDDTVVMDAEHTLTAKWEKKKYKVSFSAGNGEFMDPIPDMEVTHGDTYGTLPVPRSNDLRKFNYWYYDDGENNTAYGEESQVKEGDHTLTASWGSMVFVRFLYEDSEGNECVRGRSQIYGNLYRDVPELVEKEGYDVKWVFSGQNSLYDGTQFFPEMIVSPDYPTEIRASYVMKF